MAKKMPKTYKGKSTKLGGGGRFAKLKDTLTKGDVKDPKALAASIGRKKLGKAKFQKLASKGRKKASSS